MKNKTMNHQRLIILVFVSLFSLGGCTVKFGYNNLDFFLPWYLDRYIDLSDMQEDFLEEQIENHVKWHRSTQLPNYAKLLKQFNSDLQDGLTDSELAYQEKEWEQNWQVLVERVLDDAAELLLTSNNEQLQELKDKQLESQQKFKKKYVDQTASKRRQQHQDGMLEYFEETLGDITEEQKQSVIDWSNRISLTDQIRFEYRNTWLQTFHNLLDQRYSQPDFKQQLSELILNPKSLQPKELQNEYAYNEQLDRELWLNIDRLMTPKQRETLTEETLDIIDDIEDLMEDD